MNETKLLPCPFCGGEATHFRYSGSACVGCKDCIAYLGGEESTLSETELATAWNRRAPSNCLHQIQEPSAAEQAAWHAGLDEGRAQATGSVSNATSQAAPAAVAAPDERAAFESWARSFGTWEVKRDDDPALGTTGYTDVTLTVAWHAIQARAALAATPANCDSLEQLSENNVLAPVVLPEPDAAVKEVMQLVERHRQEVIKVMDDEGSLVDVQSAQEAIESKLRALLAGVSAPAAQLLALATELHEKGFMPWSEAEELALREAGIDDAAIDELVGNCGSSGLSSVICTPDELRTFTRAVLVHQPATAALAAPQAPADARDAERRDLDAQELQGIALQAAWRGGLEQNAPAYLPRSPVSAAVFKAHDWVIEAMKDAIKAAQAAQQGGAA